MVAMGVPSVDLVCLPQGCEGLQRFGLVSCTISEQSESVSALYPIANDGVVDKGLCWYLPNSASDPE